MQGPVYNELTPVRRRQRWLFAWRTTVLGVLAGSVACLAVLLAAWLTGRAELLPAAGAVLAAGPVLGFLARFLWERNLPTPAPALGTPHPLQHPPATPPP